VWLPASLDLLNTVLGNIGLVWVNSSIYQMTRGSVVIFSAFLSVKWLGRTLRQFHYWSIVFVLVAVVLVGFAGTQEAAPDDDECADDDGGGDSKASAGQVILGLGFILAAQLVTAVQFIVEERFMCDKATMMSPTALVGFEGLWGMAMFCVLAPILSFTPRSDLPISTVWHENFYDAVVQLSNSSTLMLSCIGYMIAILAYNVSANFVTQCLSAVVRSILEACRTLGVWIVGLLLFYLGGSCGTKAIGEAWSPWSFLELVGFAILLAGTFSYKALIKIPW
jgi:drug/metabolite transporter (DMT)-like permease